jgi:hypothetical protein
MAGDRQLQPSTDADAIDRCEDRHIEFLEGGEDRLYRGYIDIISRGGGEPGEVVKVETC